ncbi:MAG: hypothetical protein OCC49_08240 [Fibrobacterales bacterium]
MQPTYLLKIVFLITLCVLCNACIVGTPANQNGSKEGASASSSEEFDESSSNEYKESSEERGKRSGVYCGDAVSDYEWENCWGNDPMESSYSEESSEESSWDYVDESSEEYDDSSEEMGRRTDVFCGEATSDYEWEHCWGDDNDCDDGGCDDYYCESIDDYLNVSGCESEFKSFLRDECEGYDEEQKDEVIAECIRQGYSAEVLFGAIDSLNFDTVSLVYLKDADTLEVLALEKNKFLNQPHVVKGDGLMVVSKNYYTEVVSFDGVRNILFSDPQVRCSDCTLSGVFVELLGESRDGDIEDQEDMYGKDWDFYGPIFSTEGMEVTALFEDGSTEVDTTDAYGVYRIYTDKRVTQLEWKRHHIYVPGAIQDENNPPPTQYTAISFSQTIPESINSYYDVIYRNIDEQFGE